MSQNTNGHPLLPTSLPITTDPIQCAHRIGLFIKAGSLILGWVLVGLTVLAFAVVTIRALWAGVRVATQFLGI